MLLARALYRKPRILFLDEGTSQLDPALEQQINDEIGKLAITRIVIAHRPQTVMAADRVFLLHQGSITEIAKPRVALPASPSQPLLSEVKSTKPGEAKAPGDVVKHS